MPASTADRPSPGEADRHVAARLRRRRLGLGPTQHQLAGLLGISPRQAHEYETRASLLPADRLAAAALGVGVGVGVDHFFEGLGRDGAPEPALGQRQALELACLFGRLSGPGRETLRAMVRALAKKPAPARAA